MKCLKIQQGNRFKKCSNVTKFIRAFTLFNVLSKDYIILFICFTAVLRQRKQRLCCNVNNLCSGGIPRLAESKESENPGDLPDDICLSNSFKLTGEKQPLSDS
ncbi:Uncharacterised protein g3439 [Pycnogonum litorale]